MYLLNWYIYTQDGVLKQKHNKISFLSHSCITNFRTNVFTREKRII